MLSSSCNEEMAVVQLEDELYSFESGILLQVHLTPFGVLSDPAEVCVDALQ